MDDLHDKLLRPLAIGGLRLDRRLFMAPMAGISRPAFRRSVRRFGAGLVFTEMISAQGIVHDNRHTLAYLACQADEHPIGFQLFAAEPAALARAARACVAAGADLVDLNMACPVGKVMKTGAGAALLAAPDLAVECVRAVVEEVGDETPVTVKIRAGLRSGDEAGSRLAPRLAAAGAAAICIHPRYASQLYRGAADHALTLALARELPVPVIASGDIASVGADGRPDRAGSAGLLDGGVAAVAVARAALGRPWVFRELLEGEGAPPLDERRRALALFVDDAGADLGRRAVGYLRRFWPRFRRSGVLDAGEVARLMAATDMATIARLVRAGGG
jgi:nifR3 family TIM-barrel protein